MLTPEQQRQFSSFMSGLGPMAQQTLGNFLQPMGQEQMDEIFQKAYIDPAMQTYQQKMLPAIQQSFADANASSSSALNQALAQSAGDLSTSLGSQYGQFYQNQQQNQLQALSQYLPMLTNQTFSPMISQQHGLAGPLIGAAGNMGAGWMMSSKKVKENLRSYKKGLEDLKQLTVHQYDYIQDVGGEKDKVGLIAEDLPKELTKEIDGILHVDLYGLLGLIMNAVKDLDEKVEKMDAYFKGEILEIDQALEGMGE